MSTSSSSKRCRQFSLEEINVVTNQFGNKLLGKGGEAMVYFAEIYIGSKKTPVAVKHLIDLKNKRDNTKEFESEIQTLAKIQHSNIVSLIGYCNESGQKILVYEYMKKGSLSDYLKKKKDKHLSWLQRLNICLDVARGLQHLHSETNEFPKGLIHRDVKPGNILVGENWVGKLSDFGMLKLSNAGQVKSSMVTDRKGTAGYYAPEYLDFGRVTRKIDVFAFGVVLFQVLCEKMPWDREDESYYFDENEDLGIWAQKNVDAQIRREMSGDSFTLFTDIIGRSLQGDPGKRPTMEKVVLDLEMVLLECQESVNQPKQLDDTEETYLQPSPSKQPTIDDVVLKIRFRQFSIKEIKAGTNKFDRRRIIGQGTGSTVYFAGIYIGSKITPVAVALFKYNILNFKLAIYPLSKIQHGHPNLVSLIGYCNESDYKILVYEYMAKGCLSRYLEKGSCISFSWLERLNVCLGAARGLQHLHTETDEFPKGKVHFHVRPGNIFVGENWVGKLSEFKMFSIVGHDYVTITFNSMVVYYAPEYLMLGRVTRKTDVYAFGIVLFQVLCGKLHRGRIDQIMDESYSEQDLGIWAQENIDSQIRGETSEKSLTLFIDIIWRCLQKNPGKRPSMNDVVLNIQKAVECQEYENLEKQVEKEYEELTHADQTNPSSSNPIKEKVKGSGQDDKPTCQICKGRNHEAIEKEYELTHADQTNPTIKGKVRWKWTRCHICKRINHEVIDC